jgi:hypothetical protein
MVILYHQVVKIVPHNTQLICSLVRLRCLYNIKSNSLHEMYFSLYFVKLKLYAAVPLWPCERILEERQLLTSNFWETILATF